jgi:hypothetical protein
MINFDKFSLSLHPLEIKVKFLEKVVILQLKKTNLKSKNIEFKLESKDYLALLRK